MKFDVEQLSATHLCRLGLALPCQVREHLVDLRPETEKQMTGLVSRHALEPGHIELSGFIVFGHRLM